MRWFCVEKVKIEALKGKIFNFNENNENHKVYPSACGSNAKMPPKKRNLPGLYHTSIQNALSTTKSEFVLQIQIFYCQLRRPEEQNNYS
jgi:hypothetical protein